MSSDHMRPRALWLVVAAISAVAVVGALVFTGATHPSPSPTGRNATTATPPGPVASRPAAGNPQNVDAAKVAALRLGQRNTLRDLLDSTLGRLVGPPHGAFAKTTYEDATWSGAVKVNQCWRCLFGPAVAAAALAAKDGSADYTTIAEDTFDAALGFQQPSGAFVVRTSTQSIDIDTMYFTTELAQAYQLLLPYLGTDRRTAWSVAIGKAADFLVANGNLTWYTNGNINLGNVTVMAAAWKDTGRPIYQTYMNQALDFAMNPPQLGWPGYGLVYTTTPTRADGSDGAAYFTEKGPGGVGFDADYTQLQADDLARLYQLTNDPRILRLMNLLVNQLMSLTDTTNWHLNTSGGSRHTGTDDWRYLTTPALMIVVWQGGRADLAGFVPSQLDAIVANFSNEDQFLEPGTWFAFGQEAASAYLASTR